MFWGTTTTTTTTKSSARRPTRGGRSMRRSGGGGLGRVSLVVAAVRTSSARPVSRRRLALATPQAQGAWRPIARPPLPARPEIAVVDLTTRDGRTTPYEAAMAVQRRLLEARASRDADSSSARDALVLVEHDAVYTLGRGATAEHVRYDPDAAGAPNLVRCERGGDVTYHGPGQLVAYPVLQLAAYRKDSHWYLRALEEVVIRVCTRLGLDAAARHAEHTGVWLRGRKVAAVGVALRRWVTYHGVALNVAPDLADFDRIVPCGLKDEPVGSLDQALREDKRNRGGDDASIGDAIGVADVAPIFLEEFAGVFEADLVAVPDARNRMLGEGGAALPSRDVLL